jgi:hypothetical protein
VLTKWLLFSQVLPFVPAVSCRDVAWPEHPSILGSQNRRDHRLPEQFLSQALEAPRGIGSSRLASPTGPPGAAGGSPRRRTACDVERSPPWWRRAWTGPSGNSGVSMPQNLKSSRTARHGSGMAVGRGSPVL